MTHALNNSFPSLAATPRITTRGVARGNSAAGRVESASVTKGPGGSTAGTGRVGGATGSAGGAGAGRNGKKRKRPTDGGDKSSHGGGRGGDGKLPEDGAAAMPPPAGVTPPPPSAPTQGSNASVSAMDVAPEDGERKAVAQGGPASTVGLSVLTAPAAPVPPAQSPLPLLLQPPDASGGTSAMATAAIPAPAPAAALPHPSAIEGPLEAPVSTAATVTHQAAVSATLSPCGAGVSSASTRAISSGASTPTAGIAREMRFVGGRREMQVAPAAAEALGSSGAVGGGEAFGAVSAAGVSRTGVSSTVLEEDGAAAEAAFRVAAAEAAAAEVEAAVESSRARARKR